jgi:hypothetical protein
MSLNCSGSQNKSTHSEHVARIRNKKWLYDFHLEFLESGYMSELHYVFDKYGNEFCAVTIKGLIITLNWFYSWYIYIQ